MAPVGFEIKISVDERTQTNALTARSLDRHQQALNVYNTYK
jgi:hypothetical protein